jgi:lipid II:glycine glycyltransferase (peptidoglycan interpeptide bridge formation enzyme)
MTHEQIEVRLAELNKELQQLTANANAVNGAIQDCEFWLAQLDAEEYKKRLEMPLETIPEA